MTAATDPHAAGRLVTGGAPLARARLVLVAIHGRGADAAGMLDLAQRLAVPDVAVLAPEAAGRSWWPVSFLAPMEVLAPWVASATAAVDRAMAVAAGAGFGPERVVLLGFSQGGCLALEYAARAGRPLAGVFGIAGGLVGTGEAGGPALPALYGHPEKSFDYPGRLDGLPLHLSCHENDPHIPLARVQRTGEVFRGLGARVRMDIGQGSGHGFLGGDGPALRGALNTG